MIAGKCPEPPGGDGQGFVESKLGAEIRNRFADELRGVLSRPGFLGGQVMIEIRQNLLHPNREGRVLEANPKFVRGQFVENGNGVVVKVLPATRGEIVEEFLRILVPAPPEVASEPMEAGDEILQFRRCQRSRCHDAMLPSLSKTDAWKAPTQEELPGVGRWAKKNPVLR